MVFGRGGSQNQPWAKTRWPALKGAPSAAALFRAGETAEGNATERRALELAPQTRAETHARSLKEHEDALRTR